LESFFFIQIDLSILAFYIQKVQKQVIVIIGGPGSGKTTIINALSKMGYCCYPEISRQVTIEAKQKGIDQLFLTNPLLFSEMLLEGRINQYKSALLEDDAIVFLDRGIPDVLAYMNFLGDDFPDDFDTAGHEHKYSRILVLPPWKEIYTSDSERYENFEQAQEIFMHLKETYQSYGYELTEVPIGTVEERVQFILNTI
jgi:predicted ATPase